MNTPQLTRSRHLMIVLLLVLLGISPAAANQATTVSAQRTPVVIFPAFHFTKLKVKVKKQSVAPECPKSGNFQEWFLNDQPTKFSQICQDKLFTLVYDPNLATPMAERFSNQPGVKVDLLEYGKTESAPFYEELYVFLETAGYTRNENIRVAGYDSRLTPDMGGFLERTIELIEETYHDNNETPVHLVAHSNGPFYAQYLLTHTSQAWKDTYIHGFTPIAGNWTGQGLLYPVYFTGLNTIDFGFPTDPANAASSAAMYQTFPSSYMSSADPDVFQDQEIVVEDAQTGKTYTPQDNIELFQDAGLSHAAELAAYYTGFVKFADPASFPNVDVYAEKGSGFATLVGLKLQNLSVGQVADLSDDNLFVRDGDGNQEDITNDAIQVWENMDCFRFEFTDNDLDHFSLPTAPAVLQRLLNNLQRSKSVCS